VPARPLNVGPFCFAWEAGVKISCPCGEMIYDGGHTQPDKARFVTSQAWSDFLGAKAGNVSWRELASLIDRDLFQCSACGRLFVQGHGEGAGYWCFLPEDDRVPKELFRTRTSREGEA
jgi:hypothetical protein